MPDNKYSTDEQNTGKKWIDGRPIYRKVVRGTLSNNPIKQALPYVENTHQSGITSIDGTNITISGSYPWGNSEVSIVLEYVK